MNHSINEKGFGHSPSLNPQLLKGKAMNAPKKPEAQAAQPAGHVACSFPDEIPLHSLGHLANIVRRTEKLVISDALQHAGCALGSVGKLMGPNEAAGATADEPMRDVASMSDESLADELDNAASSLSAPQAGETAPFLPPFLMTILATVLQRLIERYFSGS